LRAAAESVSVALFLADSELLALAAKRRRFPDKRRPIFLSDARPPPEVMPVNNL
jgi:hypothetical protein